MSCTQDPIDIIRGTDHTLKIELKDENGSAFDLTGVTEAMLAFPSDGPAGSGNLTLITGLSIASPPELGVLIATLIPAFTIQLRVAKKQNFELKIVRSGKTFKVQFLSLLNVLSSSI